MNNLNILSLIAGLTLSFLAYFLSPENVATHFGFNGQPDAWASSITNLYLSLGVYVFLMLPLTLLPFSIKKKPISFLNIPNKEFWVKPSNLNLLYQKLEYLLSPFVFATILLYILIQSLALFANLSNPISLNQKFIWGGLSIYLAYTAYWCYCLYRSLSLPNENS